MTLSQQIIPLLFISCLSSSFPTEAKQKRHKKQFKKTATVQPDPHKYVIGSCGNTDFFTEFFAVVNHISWSERSKKKLFVNWDNNCRYHHAEGHNGATNAWEYYFYPISHLTCQAEDIVHRQFNAPDNHSPNCPYIATEQWNPPLSVRYQIKKLLDKHITIKANVVKKMEDFFQQHMKGKKTIGVHWYNVHSYPDEKSISPQDVLDCANNFAQQGYQFLVASNDNAFLDKAKLQLKGDVIIYSYPRLNHRSSLHNMALVGEDILVEALLLSRCEKFVYTKSYFAAGVLCFNPALEAYAVGETLTERVYHGVSEKVVDPAKTALRWLGIVKK